MVLPNDTPIPIPIIGDPPLSFRFLVQFFSVSGIINPTDMLFQRVSGIDVTMTQRETPSGTDKTGRYTSLEKLEYKPLVLERGLFTVSILGIEISEMLTTFQVKPSNVLVILLNASKTPVGSWLFFNAIPTRWRLSDFDADSNKVVIETIELSYQRMHIIRL